MKKTSLELEQKVIQSYLEGNSCKTIGNQLGLNSVTIFNILKRNNIQTRTNGGIYKLPVDDIIKDYKNGIRIQDISIKYNVNPKTIYNYLESANEDRNYIYINKSLKRDYFSTIDSYDKAYFLGFMISDGCVLDNNSISMTLRIEDAHILRIFNKKISNENPLYFNGNRPNLITMHFKSKQIKNDLSKYGVVPRKSLTTYMPILSDKLMPHLIRGLFDGNGWITSSSYSSIGYCAGNERIVTEFKDWLVNKLSVYNVKIMHTNENVYQCSWGSRNDIIKIGNYMYLDKKDCFLRRKYNKFMIISS